ncbi:hypothetical protein D3C72_2121670 [compost metagenome]
MLLRLAGVERAAEFRHAVVDRHIDRRVFPLAQQALLLAHGNGTEARQQRGHALDLLVQRIQRHHAVDQPPLQRVFGVGDLARQQQP